jgi:hypothetical protein
VCFEELYNIVVPMSNGVVQRRTTPSITSINLCALLYEVLAQVIMPFGGSNVKLCKRSSRIPPIEKSVQEMIKDG